MSHCVFLKIADKVKENLSGLDGSLYIRCAPLVARTGFTDPDLSIEEYMGVASDSIINIYLHFSPNSQLDIDALYNNMSHALDGLDTSRGTIYLYIMESEYALRDPKEYFETHDQAYIDYHKSMRPYYKGAFRITDNMMEMSREEFNELNKE